MDLETIETYNRGAEHFAQEFDSLGPRKSDIAKAFSYINKTNPKVVELGCGNGRDAKEILAWTTDYTGVDVSTRLLDIARMGNPEANFVADDLETFEFPAGIDLIYASASLLHSDMDTLTRVIRRAHTALNPGGIIFISLKEGSYHCEVKTDIIGTRTFYYYTPKDIRLISPLGLRIAELERQHLRGQDWFTMILQKTS